MIIAILKLIASIACRLDDQFKAAGRVPVPNPIEYLGMSVTRYQSKQSIAIVQIGYMLRILDHLELANCRKYSTPLEVGHKPHAIQADEQLFQLECTRRPLDRFSMLPSALDQILHLPSHA